MTPVQFKIEDLGSEVEKLIKQTNKKVTMLTCVAKPCLE